MKPSRRSDGYGFKKTGQGEPIGKGLEGNHDGIRRSGIPLDGSGFRNGVGGLKDHTSPESPPLKSPLELKRVEIFDWWESERFRVYTECVKFARSTTNWAMKRVDKWPDRKLLQPETEMRSIVKQVDARIERFNRGLGNRLFKSVGQSVSRIERPRRAIKRNPEEVVPPANQPRNGWWAVDVAVDEVLTAGNDALKWISDMADHLDPLQRPRRRVKKRCKKYLKEYVANRVTAETKGRSPQCTWVCFKRKIDDAARARLEDLS